MFGYARYYIQRKVGGPSPSCDPVPPGTRDVLPQTLRTDYYDTPSVESISNIVVDQYGAVYAVGTFSRDYEDPSYNDTLREAVLWKINSDGELLWQRGLKTEFPNGFNDESFTGVAIDSQSNVYVTGQSNEQTWPARLIVGKCDACGTFKWKKILKQSTNNETLSGVRCTVDTTDTKLLVTGGITRFDGSYSYNNLLVICFDAATGTVLWNREIRYPSYEYYYGTEIFVDSQNDVIVISEQNSYNYIVSKFNVDTGNNIWTKEIINETPTDGGFYSVINNGATSSSLLHFAYALGGTASLGSDDSLYICYLTNGNVPRLMKIDTNGVNSWEVEVVDNDVTYGVANPKIFVGTNNQIYVVYEKKYESSFADFTVDGNWLYVRILCLSAVDGSMIFNRQLMIPTEEVSEWISINVVHCDNDNFYIGGELIEVNPVSFSDQYPRGFIFRFPQDGSETDFYYYIEYTDKSDVTISNTFTNLTHTADSTAIILGTGPGGAVQTPAYQDINFEPATLSGPIVGENTGVTNDATEYRVQASINNGTIFDIIMLGSEIQTFDDLILKLQTALPTCSVANEGTNSIRITTNAVGEGNSVVLNDYPLAGGNGYNLTSTNHTDYSSCTATFTFEGPAVLNFEWRVSSEDGYDFLYIEVDALQEVNVSGEQGGTFSKAYAAGTHNIYIDYYKDSSVSAGLDTGWITNMWVTDPGGLTLTSNSASATPGFTISGGPGTQGGTAAYPGLIRDAFNGGASPWNLTYYGTPVPGADGDFANIAANTNFTEAAYTHEHNIKVTQKIPSITDNSTWVLQTNGAFNWQESFTIDSEDNIIVFEDLLAIKMDSFGNIIWKYAFPYGIDFVYAIGTDLIIITRGGLNSYIERYDKDMNRIWGTSFNNDLLFGYIDGNGDITSATATSGVVKIQGSTGNVLWAYEYDMSYKNTWHTAGDDVGNVYVVAGGYAGTNNNRNSITKLDPNGNLLWHRDLEPNTIVTDELQYGFDMEWDAVCAFDVNSQTFIGVFTIWSHIIIMGFDPVDGTTKWQTCLAQLYDNFPRPLGYTFDTDGNFVTCIDTFRTTILSVNPGSGQLVRKFFLAPEDRQDQWPIGSRFGVAYNEAWGIAIDSGGYMYQTIGNDLMIKIPQNPTYGYYRNFMVYDEPWYVVDSREITLNVPGTVTGRTTLTYTATPMSPTTLTPDPVDKHVGVWKIAAVDPVKDYYEATGFTNEMILLNGNKMYLYAGEPLAYQYGRNISLTDESLVISGDFTMYLYERRPDNGWDTSMSRAYYVPSYSGTDYIHDTRLVDDYLIVGNKGSVYSDLPGYAHIMQKQIDGKWKALQTFRSSTNTSDIDDGFGWRVAMTSDNNTFVVDKLYHLESGIVHGQIATYTRATNQLWTLTSSVTTVPPTTINGWGNKGCVSGNGNIALIGGNYSSPGSIQVLEYSGGSWIHQAIITASGASTVQPQSYALNDDGTVAAIGAENLTVSGKSYAGGVYVFTRSGSTWTQAAILVASDGLASDYLGRSVGMNAAGTAIIAGSPYADVTGTTNSGAAYIFTGSGASWTQAAKLVASNKATNNYFGNSVAMSDNGLTVIIGASGRNAGYVFKNTGTWTEQQFISSFSGAGSSCDISGNGSVIALGGSSASTTTVGVYRFDGSTWVGGTVSPPEYTYNASFGKSISFSTDGNLLFIGAPGAKPSYGKVYVYTWTGITWKPYQAIHETREAMWEYGTPTAFGQFVDVTNADNVFVGAYGAAWQIDPGGYYYEKIADGWVESDLYTPTVSQTGFGRDMILHNDQTLYVISVAAAFMAEPICKILKLSRVGSAWIETETISVPGFSMISNMSISASGTRIAVGGEGTDAPYTRQHGKVVVLENTGVGWTEIFSQNGPHENAWFGMWDFSVKLSSDGASLLVGAPGFKDNKLFLDNHVGQLFFYGDITNPSNVVKYLPSDSQFYYARFGRTVVFDEFRGSIEFVASSASHFSDLSSWSTDPINDIGGMVYAISGTGV